ncbi:MAG: Asp-tRNA(Asn)/Glu-tRNA(Gln) amidotransferase subunit GatB [Ruminococcaceae bacterium]|nr:Asp-tRNA(Asn)/Glu-tRNA(Gln) amidotransferase subunit GatB [Oscillospiraceae bacterium]
MNNNVNYGAYEAVIGLEVHAELKTKTKIFCSCKTDFGAPPNTQCCPVCAGLPGALPVLNEKVIDLAVLASLALNCEINGFCIHDRKNYFYPDLPKAYQISQLDLPVAENGYIDITSDKVEKRIGIERIHIEEDAGKLVHSEGATLIDLNRCGVPLIEIVSKPDMRTAAEAAAYLEKLRSILLFTGVSDCKMNEGSLRCDVNVSIRKKGDTGFGIRTEIKNINSVAYTAKAIDYEIKRQIELVEGGMAVERETRRYDEKKGITTLMRKKESAEDYRYFTDPDLPPFSISEERISRIRSSMPILPDERAKGFTKLFGLAEGDAKRLASSPDTADYFEAAAAMTDYPKILASLMLCELPVISADEDQALSIPHRNIADLCNLQGSGKINSSVSKSVLREMLETCENPHIIVKEKGLMQIDDPEIILSAVKKVFAENQKAISDYQNGKTAAAKSLVGRVMGATGGRANPTTVARLVEDELKKIN